MSFLSHARAHGLAAAYGPACSRPEGFSPAHAAFVARQRKLGASWDALGRMLGRPGATVQAAFDPDFVRTYQPVAPAAQVPAFAPAKPKRRSAGDGGPVWSSKTRSRSIREGSKEHLALTAVAAGPPVSSADLAAQLSVSLSSGSNLLSILKRKAFVAATQKRSGVYALTRAGQAELKRLGWRPADA